MEGQTDRDEADSMGMHRQIFTTYLHHKFTLHIVTTDFHHELSLQIFMTFSPRPRSENSDFHNIFTTFSRHGLDLIFFPPIFHTDFHDNQDFHDIFTMPIVKIEIFMAFSPRS